ncbi:MAG: amino acid permease [Flavobacteriales bacterium]
MSSLFRKKTISSILNEKPEGHSLNKTLGVRDLTAFGIAAIIGAGIFSTIGRASYEGGPGVVFLFIFTAIACGFAALAYAEFASTVPVSGSAYTYSYVAFGELFAWIIGWALIMEYAIGNITVAISWSDYLTSLIDGHTSLHIPDWMTTDYFTAKSGHETIASRLADGVSLAQLEKSPDFGGMISSYRAWENSPIMGSMHVIIDLPAMFIVALISWLVYRGMRESKNAANIMVGIKITIVLLIIMVGFFYVDSDNYTPFMPNGIGGVLAGISSVFFAYIGFDAISTAAEECKNPQRDLPKAIINSIIICTVLYVLIALVITGMVNYKELNVGDPLAYVFNEIKELEWLELIVAFSAVVAMASVLLVFQMGQPRIWMAMSRDGLLPKTFSKIHPKYLTPYKATIIAGFLVGVPILFVDLELATNMCSIGTLFAFVLVCAGVIRLRNMPDAPPAKFRVPDVNSRFILPLLFAGAMVFVFASDYQKATVDFFSNEPVALDMGEVAGSLNESGVKMIYDECMVQNPAGFDSVARDITLYLDKINPTQAKGFLITAGAKPGDFYLSGTSLFLERIPFFIFLLVALYFCISALWRKYPLIPVLGLLCCLYMMSEIGLSNWLTFSIWLVVGLIIYFSYGRKHSKLANQ